MWKITFCVMNILQIFTLIYKFIPTQNLRNIIQMQHTCIMYGILVSVTNLYGMLVSVKFFKNNIWLIYFITTDSTFPGADICLEAGEHKYPFRFHIPHQPLPDPFEGEYGYIRYKVKAKIDRPSKFNHETQKLFSVIGVCVDLNEMPELASVSLIVSISF